MSVAVSVNLQHCIESESGCICADDCDEVGVEDAEDGGGANGSFELKECSLLFVGPCEGSVVGEEGGKRDVDNTRGGVYFRIDGEGPLSTNSGEPLPIRQE